MSHHHAWLQAMNEEEEDTAEFAKDVMVRQQMFLL